MIKVQSVFTRAGSSYEGEMPMLYRTTEEIGKDIKEIKRKIASAYGRLNIRNILTEAMASYSESEPEMWVPELYRLVDEADYTLGVLRGLRDDLDVLKAELEDARWKLGS